MKMDWDELNDKCMNCQECALHTGRKNVVIGRGNINASIMFIGEGPSEKDDETGVPFVGTAGELLNNLLIALKIPKELYYITNVVKCRPPSNRVPLEEEARACLNYLRSQVSLIKPKIIVCLGATAVKYIIDENAKITSIRGTWINKKNFEIMPTFHPESLLTDSSKKILMWQDFKKVEKRIREIC
jgi:DNA polymerase